MHSSELMKSSLTALSIVMSHSAPASTAAQVRTLPVWSCASPLRSGWLESPCSTFREGHRYPGLVGRSAAPVDSLSFSTDHRVLQSGPVTGERISVSLVIRTALDTDLGRLREIYRSASLSNQGDRANLL